jgi:putative transposase
MIKRQAFKFKLEPNGEQYRMMTGFADACRWVFNKGLELNIKRHEAGEKYLNYYGTAKLLTEWRHDPEKAWLAKSSAIVQQQVLKDLDRAFQNFFKKLSGFPKFKKKGRCVESFRFSGKDCITLDEANNRIKFPRIGWLRYRKSRNIKGTIKNVTVSKHFSKWYVSIQTEYEYERPMPNGDSVGIDMGIVRFATLSNGKRIDPLNSFKRLSHALRKAQQSLSRKVKGSNNWKKAKTRVQRIHEKIRNARLDFLHKTTTAISNNHAMVCIEDLKIKNMSKSASGTIEKPGKSVKAKSGLNRSILDQAWGMFRSMLEYKVDWRGGYLVTVPPQNTSRRCPACDHVSVDNRKTQEKFLCVECGFEENADVVGAINILRAGLARIACEVNDAVMSSAAGTHRRDLGVATC